MIFDMTKRFKNFYIEQPIEEYKWDNGTYLLLNTENDFDEEIKKEKYFKVEKNIIVENAEKKELHKYFYKRDNKTKALNKDYNKLIDSNKKRFWSRMPAYLNIKITNYILEDTIDGFEKEVFPYFLDPQVYLKKLKDGKIIPSKKSGKETILEDFKEFAPKEYEYLFSDFRKEKNEKIIRYIRENWLKIRDYIISKKYTKSQEKDWFIIALNFADEEEEMKYYQNESDLYLLLKQFLVNEYNFLEKEEKTIVGMPNFLFNANDDKKTLFTNTQKTKSSILVTSEEVKDRLEMYNFFESTNKYKITTLTKDNEVKEGATTGIQFIYNDEGVIFLENNPVLERNKFKAKTEKLSLLNYSEAKEYNQKELIKQIATNFYGQYCDEERNFDIQTEKEYNINKKNKNRLEEKFILDAAKLKKVFERNNQNEFESIIRKELIDSLIITIMYGTNQKMNKTEKDYERNKVKSYRALNILLGLQKHLGKSRILEIIKEDNDKRKENDEKNRGNKDKENIKIEVKTKEEYFYYLGQIIYYINSKKEQNNKEFYLTKNFLNIKKNKELKNYLIKSLFENKEKMRLNDKLLKNFIEELLEFEIEENITREDKVAFLAGVMVKSVFYHTDKEKGDEKIE